MIWRSVNEYREVLLVHRPRYDDWSFPKGKLQPGEDHLAAALREVLEETGLICDVGPELPEVRYIDRKGRPKRVRYWAMQASGGRFSPNHEVDAVRWVRAAAAAGMLSYERDVAMLSGLGGLSPIR